MNQSFKVLTVLFAAGMSSLAFAGPKEDYQNAVDKCLQTSVRARIENAIRATGCSPAQIQVSDSEEISKTETERDSEGGSHTYTYVVGHQYFVSNSAIGCRVEVNESGEDQAFCLKR